MRIQRLFHSRDKENIDEWVLVVESLAENNGYSLNNLVRKVGPFLKDAALRSYLCWREESEVQSWESLKRNFYEIYNTLYSKYKLSLRIKSFKISKTIFPGFQL